MRKSVKTLAACPLAIGNRVSVRLRLTRMAVLIGMVGMLVPFAAGTVGATGEGTQSGYFFDSAEAGVHRAAVDYLAREGFLSGTECAEATFCPDDPIARWVMAVWLVRILDGREPAAVESSRFTDVDPDEWYAPYVERLADLGVTRGCAVNPARFCPMDTVKREQMASFLVRAFKLGPVDSDSFSDTGSSGHVADINALAAAGVTAGCAVEPARFCPSTDTTRAEMASFLVRALGLDPTEGDPRSCRPPSGVGSYESENWWGTGGHYGTAGFPMPGWVKSSVGVLRVAVLFVDFPNAAAAHSTEKEAALGLPYAEAYLEAASGQRLDVQFTTHDEWLRAQNNYQHYMEHGQLGGSYEASQVFGAEVTRLGDAAFAFDTYDLLMIVAPSSHFGDGNASPDISTAEGPIWTVRSNAYPFSGTGEPHEWGQTAAKGIVNALGAPDLFPYVEAESQPDPPSGQKWIEQEFGVMGLLATFPVAEEDPLLARVWRHPDGTSSTTYGDEAYGALEMLAWVRWQLGWLDSANIVCATDRRAVVGLSSVARPRQGTAMVAVPISRTEVIVIESRRKVGHDAGWEYVSPEGYETTLPSLLAEGLLVYTVDSAIRAGELPIRIAGDPGNRHLSEYPILTQGRSITVRGHTITLLSSTSTTHTVAVTPERR